MAGGRKQVQKCFLIGCHNSGCATLQQYSEWARTRSTSCSRTPLSPKLKSRLTTDAQEDTIDSAKPSFSGTFHAMGMAIVVDTVNGGSLLPTQNASQDTYLIGVGEPLALLISLYISIFPD